VEMYLWVKWVHVIGATVLFGTGLGIAFFQWMTHRRGDVGAIATVSRLVVVADFAFTLPAVILQPLTGVWMADRMGYPLDSAWLVASMVLYVFTGACWLPVVALQVRAARLAGIAHRNREPLPPQYHRTMRWWFALGWPAFIAVLATFWLMIAKPHHF
jgi:uncharacterized membrane protein